MHLHESSTANCTLKLGYIVQNKQPIIGQQTTNGTPNHDCVETTMKTTQVGVYIFMLQK